MAAITGALATDCERAGGCAARVPAGARPEEDAADDAERGCSGPTSVPTGVTLPSAEKAQLSSFSAELISVSAGQCSSVTMSVTPCRLAIPT